MIAKNFFGTKSLATSGMFVNVLAYRAKPSGLFRHQLIQYLCGFLVINGVLDSIFLFTSGYRFFPFSGLLIHSLKKTVSSLLPVLWAASIISLFRLQGKF